MFPSADTSACFPLPSSGYRGCSLRKPGGSPPSPVLRGRKTARPSFPVASGFPWQSVPPMVRRRWGALLGSWEIPLEACPELGTPATPARPRNIGRPDAAFRLVNSVGIAMSRVFGAESSRPASLLCTLRTHQSPDEWQHSLPACLLALAARDFHPLDSIEKFPLLHLGFPSPKLSQRDDPILYVAPRTVNLLVNPLWALFQTGCHEARIVLRFLVRGAHHLGFVEDSSFPRPSLFGSVLALAINLFGLTRDLRRTTSLLHGGLCFTFQDIIGAHVDEVFHFRFAIQKIQNFRGRETPVEAHPDLRLGKGIANPCNQTAQNPDGAHRTRRIPTPQHRRHQVLLGLLIKGEKTNHRQVTVAIIVAVKKGELLLAVRGVVGGIHIDGDATSASMQTLAMAFNDTVRQRFCHSKQFLTIWSIFKARQSRLRSQVLAVDGIPTNQKLVDRIRRQPCRIVGVFISQRDGHDPLSNQLTQLMVHLAGLSIISHTSRQCRSQT